MSWQCHDCFPGWALAVILSLLQIPFRFSCLQLGDPSWNTSEVWGQLWYMVFLVLQLITYNNQKRKKKCKKKKSILFLWFSWIKLCFWYFNGLTAWIISKCQISKMLTNDHNCQIHVYAVTAGTKKWICNLPVCAITVTVVRTCCMNVVLCMQLWKSKPELVLRNVDTSLTETYASSTLYFQLTEELLKLFYYIDSSSCPCTLCHNIIQLIYSCEGQSGSLDRRRITGQVYQSCQINFYNSKWTLLSGVGERSNLELLSVSMMGEYTEEALVWWSSCSVITLKLLKHIY